MGRFNVASNNANPVTANHNGGEGYKMSEFNELISYLFFGVGDTFYVKEKDQFERIKAIVKSLCEKSPDNIKLLVRTAIYVRTVVGQRTSSHLLSALLIPYVSGTSIGKFLFSKYNRREGVGGVIYRIDDMGEILAIYRMINPDGKIPNAIKKGFRNVIENSSKYEIAKYKMTGKAFSLIDIVNLTHPKMKDDESQLFIKQLMNNELKQFNTLEDALVTAGQESENREEFNQKKRETFIQMAKDKSFGYLALLRNLRNIAMVMKTEDMCVVDGLMNMLGDPDEIKKSLVTPFQISTAIDSIEFIDESLIESKLIYEHIRAMLPIVYDRSIPNLSELISGDKSTCIVLDRSRSMTYMLSSNRTPYGIGGLIACTIYKLFHGTAPILIFNNDCMQVEGLNPDSSVWESKCKLFEDYKANGCTNNGSVFEYLTRNKLRYERIIFLSDNECDSKVVEMMRVYKEYKREMNVDPYIYTINLSTNGTTQFKPNSKVYDIHGYHSGIYEMMNKVEVDHAYILNEIYKVFLP